MLVVAKDRSVPLSPSIHDAVGVRLARVDQRYTRLRRLLVETLAAAARPLTIPEIVASTPGLPQSSAYRNVTTLMEVGVVRPVPGTEDHGRYELAEELSGHHHHLVCTHCGRVDDVPSSGQLERALGEAAQTVADKQGYQVSAHRFDQLGLCPECR
jgi:Fur family transcriptional regulator, ferric uptake regulator